MVTTTEGTHVLDDGVKLYTKTWKHTNQETKAKLVFVHGFDHRCESYSDFFVLLAERGIEVFAIDLRGNGHSVTNKASKGNPGPTSRLMDDLTSLLSSQLPSTVPVFLMGHSMGGTAVLTYACLGPSSTISQISGFMGEAPDIGFAPGAAAKPGLLTVAAAKAMRPLWPHMQVPSKLVAEQLSRDPAAQQAYATDPMAYHLITVEGALDHFARIKGLQDGTLTLSKDVKAVWIGHGTEDKLTWFDESRKYIDHLDLEDKEFKEYPGWWHNLHSEPGEDKITFTNDVTTWILRRCKDT